MTEDTISQDEAAPAGRRGNIFSILAGVGFLVCLFSPRITLTTPVLATVVLGGVGVYRRERPRWVPGLLAALAMVLLLAMDWPATPMPNSIKYGHATWQYGSDETYGSWARIYSDTDIDLQRPYDGDNPAYIQLASNSHDLLLVVSQGQIVFPFRNCTVVVNSVEFSCSTPEGYGNDHLLISQRDEEGRPISDTSPEALVRKGEGVTIRVQFFDNGYRDLHFATDGLSSF